MKKSFVFLSFISLVGLFFGVQNVFSFGVPNVSGTRTESVIKDTAGTVAKTAVKDDVNKYLSSEGSKCKCNADGTVSNCNFSGIRKKVKDNDQALRAIFGRNLNFYVRASSADCGWYVRDQIGRYGWSWYAPVSKGNVHMWVE